ncbi:type VI secretion system membrane subunit TssM [Photobacterium sp. BZF1]|uniref:type VI secretion system membrane subunit TssM n=1 Tax=Photobacterium sp. BZF1 TaxID=1904457 RepID=UPI001653A652|nr:type VI secretion system membrane subunit TssM [Photobacterium sp. BZF1]MBC7006529.1 type VI secretion system membrane subunit TssM [Photobacterium sp. BZF1]
MGKSKAIVLSVLLALVVGGLTCLGLYLLGWYTLSPLWAVALEAFAILVEMGLVGWGMYVYFRKPRPVVDEDEQIRKAQMAHSIKSRFDVIWKSHPGLNTDPYRLPWYIHLSQDINGDTTFLRQTGFEPVHSSHSSIDVSGDLNSPISFWGADDAVLVSIDISQPQDAIKQHLDILYGLLLKKRDRQAINGVLCTLDLKSLVQSDELASNELSLNVRSYLTEINNRTGLSVPTYCLFTHLAGVKDCCELFSTLNEADRELPLGALTDLSGQGKYDKAWFDTTFDELIKRLSVTVSESLKQQLCDEYRESTVAGIYQLSAVKFDIEDFLASTFNQHQFDDVELNFRGYFIFNAGGEANATDVLTYLNASELGLEHLKTSPQGLDANGPSHSLFSKQLFRKYILKEAKLVGVFTAKEWRYRFTRVAALCGIALLFSGFVWTLKSHYESQQAIDNQALALLERYKSNLKSDVIMPDDLSSPIFSLYELRQISQLYQKESRPWYSMSNWLPDSSIQPYVESAYYQELNRVLLVLMRDYILKDMFVYNSLDDKVKTLELLNYHQLLYNPQRHDVDSLVNYYIAALKEEGEGDVNLLERFELLAKDVLNSGAVPPESNEELLTLVRGSLSKNDMSELLYQHILQHPNFSRRVDIRTQLAPSYASVFQFTPEFSGYLIPYVFTRDGFEELTNETGLQLASEATQAYEGVMGRISGEAEMNRINRQLRERYTNDYIQYWKTLTANISWVSVATWGESNIQLELATDPLYSPMVQLYRLIEQNTNLRSISRQLAKQEQENEAPPTALRSDTIERVASLIAAPFTSFHQLVAVGDSGQSQLDVAVKQLKETHDWVQQSTQARTRGEYFIEQLKNVDTSTPIAQQFQLANGYKDPILPAMLRGQALTINQLALEETRQFINADWQQLYSVYHRQFEGHYPFDKQSMFDASTDDFEDFFKEGGLFDVFAAKYSIYFDKGSFGETVIKGFIAHQDMIISNDYRLLEQSVKRLQSGIFSDGKLGFEFMLKAQKMSPSLTGFSIESGTKLFEYRNGPVLWRKQSWPISNNISNDISIVTTDNLGADTREKLSGVWSWFRVADKMQSSNMAGSYDVAWHYLADSSYVNLVVMSDGREQPFSPRFFAQLTLPERL